LLGAAGVGVCWVLFGGGSTGPAASFQVSSGGPPVAFLYLDNVDVATTETLSREATQTKNASVGENGISAGGSASEQSAAELSLTVTNQSRFTALLGLLRSDGFLREVDMEAPAAAVRRQFARVKLGTFVKLSNCQLVIPAYVQAEELWRAEKGRINIADALVGFEQSENYANFENQLTTEQAFDDKSLAKTHRPFHSFGSPPVTGGPTARQVARARRQMARLAERVGTNPRVPLSSCSGRYDPNVPDLLMPIRLGALSAAGTALGGHVTLVGKVLLKVNPPGGQYLDVASLQQWSGAPMWTSGDGERGERTLGIPGVALADDATVVAPGYVIQPIAIYK
jgi:hypothetical protein